MIWTHQSKILFQLPAVYPRLNVLGATSVFTILHKTLKYPEVEEALFLAVSKRYMNEKKREGISKLFMPCINKHFTQ
jgi:hypothetical protein